MRRYLKWSCRAVPLILSFFILSLVAQSESGRVSEDTNHLRVGFLQEMFTDVDIKDAQMALDIWMQKLTRDVGEDFTVESILYESIDDMVVDIHAGEVDMVQVGGSDYVEILESLPVSPAISPTVGGTPLETYVLLTHKEQNINSLQQLKNKTLLVESGTPRKNSLLWMNFLLVKSGLEPANSFFHSTREAEKTSKVILPVFFKQVDACIIDKRAFTTMSELNPQVGMELVVLFESPGLLNYISCFRNNFDIELRERIQNTAYEMHKTPEGRQILTLFHIDTAKPFEPGHLDSLRTLLEEYKTILKDRTNGQTRN